MMAAFKGVSPLDRGVLRLPLADRLYGRCLDVLRGVEIRLAGSEIDHWPTLGAQLRGEGADGHGRRRLDPLQALGNC